MKLSDKIFSSIKEDILSNTLNQTSFNERDLASRFNYSRTTVRVALNKLISTGLLVKKDRSGYYINRFLLTNKEFYSMQQNSLISLTKATKGHHKVKNEVLEFEICNDNPDIYRKLLMDKTERYYRYKRLRFQDEIPIIIEECFIPLKITNNLKISDLENSIIKFLEHETGENYLNACISISSECSSGEDQRLLILEKNEPITLIERVILSNKAEPIMYSKVRNHYKYFKFVINE